MPKLFIEDEDRAWVVDLRPGESVVLGRAADADLPIASPRASRRHLEVVARGPGHAVRDLGSTNGTTWNGVPLQGERPLADRDVVDAAGCRITYRSAP